MTAAGLSVVIPFYSHSSDLSPLLLSLEQSFSSLCVSDQKNIEIIIVNDSSPCSPRESLILPLRRIDLAVNRGVGATRNVCIKAATFNCFFCLDSDTFVPVDFFEKVKKVRQLHGHEPIIQGIVLEKTGASRFQKYLSIVNFADASIYRSGDYAEFLCSGCFMSTKDFWEEIGYFEEKFTASGGEEFEILSRIPFRSIYQSFLIEVQHDYDNMGVRIRKIWHRSKHYTKTAALNPRFSLALKLAAGARLLLSVLMFFGAAVLFLDFSFGITLIGLAYLGFLVADGGRYARYIFDRGGLWLLLLSPFFLFLEYFTAGFGAVFHGSTLIRNWRRRRD